MPPAPLPKGGGGGGGSGDGDEEEGGEAGRTPRVLMLTGTASGEKIMRAQMGRLMLRAKGKIDFYIYEGTKKCNQAEAVEIMSEYFKDCPMMMYDELTFDERNWRCYKDVRGTLATLQRVLRFEGPFDGVLGFSQGANFAVMLAAQSFAGCGAPLRFVVPLCPNAPGYARQVPELFQARLPVPALLARGEKEGYDEGVRKQLEGKAIETLGEPIVSEHVVRLFSYPEVLTHPDGHRPLPANPKDTEYMDRIIDFVVARAQCKPCVRLDSWDSLPLWHARADMGGRVVRSGVALNSAQLPGALGPGSLVAELELQGTRLYYRLLHGDGPPTGWVTTTSKSGDLLAKISDGAATASGEVWILTVGTRGDLQPFVVLAMALQGAGYRVRMLGPPELLDFSLPDGVPVTVICKGWGARSQAANEDAQLRYYVKQASAKGGAGPEGGGEGGGEGGSAGPSSNPGWERFLQFLAALGVDRENGGDVQNMAWLWYEIPKAYRAIDAEMKAGKPDLVIYNHLMVSLGVAVWRMYGVRTIFANLGLEFHFAPRAEDVFNYRTLTSFDQFVIKPLIGCAPLQEMPEKQFKALYNSPDRLLGTTKLLRKVMTPEDQEVAKDWKFTGFWVFDEGKQLEDAKSSGGPEVRARLEEFLGGGPPPVYLGWGSMPVTPQLIEICLKALRNLSLRAVIVQGWSMFTHKALVALAEAAPEQWEGVCEYADEHVLFLTKAPHEWLFPRCACTVHHGGAGTTAAALRAGVPTVVVPLGYDQPIHGEWVEKLGVGVHTRSFKELEAPELEEALRKATSDTEMRGKAAHVAKTLKSEPGVSGAVAYVSRVLRDDVHNGAAKERWDSEQREREDKERARAEQVRQRQEKRQQQQQQQQQRSPQAANGVR